MISLLVLSLSLNNFSNTPYIRKNTCIFFDTSPYSFIEGVHAILCFPPCSWQLVLQLKSLKPKTEITTPTPMKSKGKKFKLQLPKRRSSEPFTRLLSKETALPISDYYPLVLPLFHALPLSYLPRITLFLHRSVLLVISHQIIPILIMTHVCFCMLLLGFFWPRFLW